MINKSERIAVCSRSFSSNEQLRNELKKKYLNITFNDKGLSLKNDELIKFLKNHDKAIIAMEVIDEKILANLPELKVISKYGVGLDKIDLEAIRNYKIKLGWKSGVNKRSVAELAICLILDLMRSITFSNINLQNSIWKPIIGNNLSNKKIGIVGCGNVGKELVKLLQPFDCEIYVNDIVDYSDFYKKYHIKTMGLNDLLSKSDIISLHLPLNSNTKNILNSKKLSLINPNSILINTARGGLIDENFLKEMLISGRLKGAGLDTFFIEPPIDSDLLKLPNLVATPHIGGSTIESVISMGMAAINGLDDNQIP